MEEERGNVEVSTKITEPLLNVPNPRVFQQNTTSSVPDDPSLSSSIFRTLSTFDTELCADSVEWCPIDPFRDLFVCGTYQLLQNEENAIMEENKARKRLGRIYLFRVMDNGHLKLLQQLEMEAILDTKWAHITYNNNTLLGIVTATGYLGICILKNDEGEETYLKLIARSKVNAENKEVLALSLDWCTGRKFCDDNRKPRIVVSDSIGQISLFELHNEELVQIVCWSAHNFEAWISAFDYWNTNIVYTGGDDCKFKCFDTRIGDKSVSINTSHDAGVTSIHSNANREYLLTTGSYDEILRLWDTRILKRPLCEENLNGGIWRLKWDPFKYTYLLAACMYGGFRVINCRSTEAPTVIATYEEHESIAYGCDWSFLRQENVLEKNIFKQATENAVLVGTCSFYDHALKLSIIDLKEM